MKLTCLTLTIAAVCTLGSVVASHAQEPRPPTASGGGQLGDGRGFPRRNPLLALFDTNNDGVLDENEIANAANVLKKLDKNGDGKLTEDELRVAVPGRNPGRPGGEGANNAEQMVNDLMKFDKDGDGKLSKEELPERMKSLMERGDADKDGFLTKDELQKLFQSPNRTGDERRGGEEREH